MKNEVKTFIPNYIRLIVVSVDNQNSFFHLFENMFQKCSFENMFLKWFQTKKNFAETIFVLFSQSRCHCNFYFDYI